MILTGIFAAANGAWAIVEWKAGLHGWAVFNAFCSGWCAAFVAAHLIDRHIARQFRGPR